MLRICDYTVDCELHHGRTSIVYRAHLDERTVVLKVLRNEFPTAQEIERHRCELATAAPLRLAHTLRLLDQIRHGHRSVLIYEDEGTINLARFAAGRRLAPAEVLEIAIGLARALGELHGHRLVHHNLNPNNVLIDPQRRTIKLSNLELAAAPGAGVHAGGNLGYMAPERSGRTRERADYRSDLYSIGAILYELAAGKPVFAGADDAALMHAHFALEPASLRSADEGFPQILDRAIQKLLAKPRGDRYQTAAGLLADLERIKRGGDGWPDFALGELDVVIAPTRSDRLYGRGELVEELRSALHRAEQSSKPIWFALNGPAGAGKSSTVRSFIETLERRHTLLAGHAERLTQSSPHAALTQAFTHLSRQWLSLPESELLDLRAQLRGALGINIGVLHSLAPGMDQVTGPPPGLPPLGAKAEQARYELVLHAFLQVVCERQSPLILFVDDIQWADPATLAFIERLLMSDLTGCLVCTAERRETETTPALAAFRERLAAAGVRAHDVWPPSLGQQELRALLIDSFGRFSGSDAELDAVVAVVLAKTLGNPLFARQLLQLLVQEGAVEFVQGCAGREWRFDRARADRLVMSDNVLSLLGDRIVALPEELREILVIGGLAGFVFDLETVRELAASGGEVECRLQLLCDQDLLCKEDELGWYRFTHERVREASLRHLDDSTRAALHLDIGRLWLRHGTRGLFDIVGQLNLGSSRIEDPQEALRIAGLNADAARLARKNIAHDAALEYASTALVLTPGGALERDRALALSLHVLLAECQAGAGQLDAAIETFEQATVFAGSDRERVQVLERLCDALHTSGRPTEALHHVERALALLGKHVSLTPSQTAEQASALRAEQAALSEMLTRAETLATITALGDADADAAQVSRLFDKAIIGVYFAHPELLGYVTARSLDHVLATGMTPEAGLAFAWWSMILCMQDQHVLATSYARLACESYGRFGNGYYGGAATMVATAMALSWTRSYDANVADAAGSFELLHQSGNAQFASYALITEHILRVVQGADLRAMLETCERWGDYCKQYVPLETGQARIRTYCLRDLMGLAQEVPDCEAIVADYAEQRNFTDVCESLTEMARHALLRDDYRTSLRLSERAHPLFAAGAAGTLLLNYSHLVQLAIASARVARQETGDERERLLVQYDAAATRVRELSALSAENFAAYCSLVDAEGMVARQDSGRAVTRYLAAIEHAKQAGFVLVQAQATQYLAELLRTQDHDFSASLSRDAEQLYRRAGLMCKVGDSQASTADGSPASLGGIDLASVFKANDAITSEIDYDRLLVRLLELAVENAGAQRGVLALKAGDAVFVEADSQRGRVHESLDSSTRCPAQMLRYTLRSGLATVLDHGSRRAAFRDEPYFQDHATRSVLTCPIMRQAEVRGVVYLENNAVDAAFTHERLEMIRLLMGSAAIALENASLYRALRQHAEDLEQRVRDRTAELEHANAALARLVEVDGLTSIANRRSFDRACERLANECSDAALILCDVDDFKAYNDHYGHLAGDDVLRRVATAIAREAQDAVVVARYGGEEFAILLETADLASALELAQRISRAVVSLEIPHRHSRAASCVTLSLGVAAIEALTAARVATLVSEADAGLYAAKHQGRNRSVARRAGQIFAPS